MNVNRGGLALTGVRRPALEVHLLPVATRPCVDVAEPAVLDAEERARAARFRFASDRQLYVQAHTLLRRALSRHAEVAPHAWRFERGADGKPALCRRRHPDLQALRFNLSHCRGLAAVVVAREREVGIDVEPLDAMHDPAELAPTILADCEQGEWRRLGEDPLSQRRFLLTRWTLKEAALKACGSGLSRHPPRELAFAPQAGGRWSLRGPAALSPSGQPWHLLSTVLGQAPTREPAQEHHLAVAVEPRADDPADGPPIDWIRHPEPN